MLVYSLRHDLQPRGGLVRQPARPRRSPFVSARAGSFNRSVQRKNIGLESDALDQGGSGHSSAPQLRRRSFHRQVHVFGSGCRVFLDEAVDGRTGHSLRFEQLVSDRAQYRFVGT
jgi:hypothetical protein